MITDLSTGESAKYQRQWQVGWMVLNLAAMGRGNWREKVKGVKGTSLWKKGIEGNGAGAEEWGWRACSKDSTVAG